MRPAPKKVAIVLAQPGAVVPVAGLAGVSDVSVVIVTLPRIPDRTLVYIFERR